MTGNTRCLAVNSHIWLFCIAPQWCVTTRFHHKGPHHPAHSWLEYTIKQRTAQPNARHQKSGWQCTGLGLEPVRTLYCQVWRLKWPNSSWIYHDTSQPLGQIEGNRCTLPQPTQNGTGTFEQKPASDFDVAYDRRETGWRIEPEWSGLILLYGLDHSGSAWVSDPLGQDCLWNLVTTGVTQDRSELHTSAWLDRLGIGPWVPVTSVMLLVCKVLYLFFLWNKIRHHLCWKQLNCIIYMTTSCLLKILRIQKILTSYTKCHFPVAEGQVVLS